MHLSAWRVAAVCVLQMAGWTLDAQAQRESAPPEDLAARLEWLQRQGEVQLGLKPVYLLSTETPLRLEGEVLALIDHPVQRVRAALTQASAWCDILILHLNVKYCRVGAANPSGGGPPQLAVGLGRKFDEPLSSVHWLNFSFRVIPPGTGLGTPGPAVELLAAEGPLDTQDIRIAVHTAAASPDRTLLQLRYTYAQGPAARWALQLYLATVGHHKVGFSLVPEVTERPQTASARQPVTGVRGLLERNTVRYYLAVDAYLDALRLPREQQLERRLLDWFAATEQHPQQLRELDWETYVQMKRLEVKRQQDRPPAQR
jgi:hypothetical protein